MVMHGTKRAIRRLQRVLKEAEDWFDSSAFWGDSPEPDLPAEPLWRQKKQAPAQAGLFGPDFFKDAPSLPPNVTKPPPGGWGGKPPARIQPRQPSKWTSAGGVVIPSLHPDEREYVYLRKPTGKFGGKTWTLPKGRVDEGEKRKETAVREVEEETGVVARILPGSNLGRFEGSCSVTYYYVMVQTGGTPGQTDFETSEVRLVPMRQAIKLMQKTGNVRDMQVLEKAQRWLQTNAPKGDFKRRLQTTRVVVTLPQVADDLDWRLDDFRSPEGATDETKIVIRMSRYKGKMGDILKPLQRAGVTPLEVIEGPQYHIVIVWRDAFNAGKYTDILPKVRTRY